MIDCEEQLLPWLDWDYSLDLKVIVWIERLIPRSQDVWLTNFAKFAKKFANSQKLAIERLFFRSWDYWLDRDIIP